MDRIAKKPQEYINTKIEMSEHHKETFITKYIFSLDHKMIAKQFLITGMFMGVVGMTMSILFRLQLSNPGESFPVLEFFLGKNGPLVVFSILICT